MLVEEVVFGVIYIEGKIPIHLHKPRLLSRLLGDELYAGVATDLMGRDFTIFRSLGKRPSIRTEQHDSRWLNGMCGSEGVRE